MQRPRPKSRILDDNFLNSSDAAQRADEVLKNNCGGARRPAWKSLFLYTSKRHLIILSLAISTSALSGVIGPLSAIFLGKIFQAFTDFGNGIILGQALRSRIREDALMLVGVGVASWLINAGFLSFWMIFGELQAKSARVALLDGLLAKPADFYDAREFGLGSMAARLQTHIKELQLAVSQPFGSALASIATALISLLVALKYEWSLTFILLSILLLNTIALKFIKARMQDNSKKQMDNLSSAAKSASNAFIAIETVKCFNGQTHELSKYKSAIRRAAEHYIQVTQCNAIQIGYMTFATLLTFMSGFWYGSHLVVSRQRNPSDILTTFLSCMKIAESIQSILSQMVILEKGKDAGAILQETMDKISITGHSVPLKPTVCNGHIRFSNVSFAYPTRPDRLILRDVSCSINPSRITFILGPSGCGKSTLTQLLLKFYEPMTGQIYLDDQSMSDLDTHWVRNNVTVIEQRSVLFEGTLRENIEAGSHQSAYDPFQDAREAAQFAFLGNFIEKFPDGLDADLRTNSGMLSGGERQRVTIARARLRDTPVLILDESMSALDRATRSLVVAAIREWRKDRTTVFITHDTNLIRDDDFIYLFSGGSIIDSGTYLDLDRGYNSPFFQYISGRLFSCNPNGTEKGTMGLERPTDAGLKHNISPISSSNLDITRQSNKSNDIELDTLYGDFSPPVNSEAELDFSKSSRLLDFSTVGSRSYDARLRSFDSYLSLSEITRSIWPNLNKRMRRILLGAFCCAIIHAVCIPVFSWVFSNLISTFYMQEMAAMQALKWSMSILWLSVIDGAACFGMHTTFEYCGQCWIDSIRLRALEKLLDQPTSFFKAAASSSSHLTYSLDRNAEEMRSILGRFIAFGSVAACLIILTITWCLVVSWKLTMIGLVLAPISWAITRFYQVSSERLEHDSNDANDAAGAILNEVITKIKTVWALNLENEFRIKHNQAIHTALKIGIRRSLVSGFFYGISQAVMIFNYSLIFYFGAILVATQKCTVTDAMLIFSQLVFMLSNVTAIVAIIPQISSSKDAARRLMSLTRLRGGSHEHEGTLTPSNLGDIRFSRVYFRYQPRPAKLLLNGLSLNFRAGKTIALVGLSGSGKSTIASLIMRLLPFSRNPEFMSFITLGGYDIEAISTSTLRRHISLVPQTPMLFPATVSENIAYGLTPGSENNNVESIRASALAAGIHEFISSLADGYDTLIGDGGLELSGGQAQRIAIARALVRKPQILILDEATSALDAANATHIRETCRQLILEHPQMIIIIITHFKEMMMFADRILVLEDGRVVEAGTFEQLMTEEGALTRILSSQQ